MMRQRFSEGIQRKLLMKLLELDYSIEYNNGKENKAADALSRQDHSISAITTVTPSWIVEVKKSYEGDTLYTPIMEKHLVNDQVVPYYFVHSRILGYKGNICIGTSSDLKTRYCHPCIHLLLVATLVSGLLTTESIEYSIGLT
jgi:hypothetical protein